METTGKPFLIEKARVYEAYKAVKSNRGAAGVDGRTIEQFDANLKGNLYRIWNRMSSGSYFPRRSRRSPFRRRVEASGFWGCPRWATVRRRWWSSSSSSRIWNRYS